MDGFLSAIGGFILVATVVYLWSTVAELIPRKFERKNRAPEEKEFSAFFDIEDHWLDEYRIVHSDEWELGPSFSFVGDGEIYLGDDEIEGRVTVTVSGFANAYKETNIIGWGTVNPTREIEGVPKPYAKVRLAVGPDDARALVAEIRSGRVSHARVHGWQGKENLKIESFAVLTN